MRTLALVALLVAGPPLVGCIGTDDAAVTPTTAPVHPLDDLTQPVFDLILREEATIAASTGVDVWLDVFRPDVPDDVKVPVILVMTPYQSLGDATAAFDLATGRCAGPLPQDCPYDARLVGFFAPRGYAVAFADSRGNHNAGGCIDQSGPGQWQEGYETVEWLAAQPWSSGNVGMIGVSYDGETQQTTALLAPPSLKTIVPIASVAGQYDYIYYQGVPYEFAGIGTAAAYLAISAVPGQDPMAAPRYAERFECQAENFEAAADLSGDMTPYWKEREYRLLADQVTTSVLHIHGLADWNVKPIHIAGWYNELVNADAKRAIYGQWPHAWPQRDDWWDQGGIMHRWFDHYLQGIDTGILRDLPPVLIQDTDGDWRGIDSFPPLDAPTRVYHLNADLTLGDAPTGAGEHEIRDVPRDALPDDLFMGLPGPARIVAGAGSTATGQDAALFLMSDPITEPLRLTGRPSVSFTAVTGSTSTHWVVHLYAWDGTELVELNRGYQDTRHLGGLDAPADLVPGEAYDLTITMYPQDDVVPVGQQLVLYITNDDDWVHQDTTYAYSRVTFGGGAAILRLPLDPGGVPYPVDALVPYVEA